jgi:hypothetical protein
MDETFRVRRSLLVESLCGVLFFLTVGAAALYMIRTFNSPHPVAMACLLLVVPSFMVGLAAWMLVGYWRSELTIQGESLTLRGVVQDKAINLREVTGVHWRIWPDPGSVVFRTTSARLVINIGDYETEARERIILYLRSVLHPEIQAGWNFFVYRRERFKPRTPGTKPGPDEVLLKRDRWDRQLSPFLVAAGLAGAVIWWFTGSPGWFALPLAPLGFWALFRFTTPTEGIVVKKGKPLHPDDVHVYWFLLLWVLVLIAGPVVYQYLRPGMKHPDTIAIVAIIAWGAIAFYELFLLNLGQDRREREAADLVAKARGEPAADPWPSE